MRYFQDANGDVFGYDTTSQQPLIDLATQASWLEVTGSWPPETTADEKIIAALTRDVQAHLDAEANTRGYDGILSLCSYAASTNPTFAGEGQAGVEWRDAVWGTCYTIMADVESDNRPVPTRDELIAELPPMVWP